jgi:signal transduction histidine kinase/PAS domain-containing protein/ActR/RegA family two-component response regulator
MRKRRAWLKWWASTDKRTIRPTNTSLTSAPRATSIQLPAEYLDGFVEVHDDVVVFIDQSIAALLASPAGLRDVVGQSLKQFAALCWTGNERAMSEFSDMVSGCHDRCHTPSVVSGKQLEWTALRSRERASRCMLLVTVREHQECTALSARLASYETTPSAIENVGTIGSQLDQRILDKTSVAKVVSDSPTNIILDTNASTQKEYYLGHDTSPKTSFVRPVLGPSLKYSPPVAGRLMTVGRSPPVARRHTTMSYKSILKRTEESGPGRRSSRGTGYDQSFKWEDNSLIVAQEIIEKSPVAIVMVNHALKIRKLNPATLNMFGYSTEDNLLEFDQICPREIPGRGKRKDGSTFPIDIATCKCSDGQSILNVHLINDITEHVSLQEKIFEAKESELNHLKSMHQIEMLEKTDQARRHFVSYVFHEIRVPFQVVMLGISELEAMLGELTEKSQHLLEANRHHLMTPGIESMDIEGLNRVEIVDDIKEATRNVERILDSALDLRKDDVLMSAFMHQVFRDQPDIINTVLEATGSIERLLDDVLSLQKIEAGEFRIEQRPFLMSNVIQIAEKRSALMMTKAGLHFKVRIDPEVVALENDGTSMVLGDYHRILQVLTNFMSNASKFTPKGGAVVVDLVLNSVGKTKPWKLENNDGETVESERIAVLLLKVTDTGVGIPPEKRESIFLPYNQIRAGELQAGGGTGLGLCISNEFVRRHGGNVVVTENLRSPSSLLSDEGKDDGGTGSVFTASLPLRVMLIRTKTADGKDSFNKASSSSTVDMANYTAHILLVEDSVLNQKMVGKLLQRYKLTYEIASNGQEAVDRVVTRDERYHMILMDKEMPIMDGHGATMAIRKVGNSVPIVGLTGNALDEQRVEFLACGADAVLTKPLNRSQFEHVVHRFMSMEISYK